LLSGGETTVTVRGSGCRGRNCEFLLALAFELNGAPDLYAIACDTDGIDGVTEATGAIITPDSLERAIRFGLDAQTLLENNDTYSFFAALDDLVMVGPTGTNVNDFRCVLRLPHPGQTQRLQRQGLELG
jgi:glycerate 2-kinase